MDRNGILPSVGGLLGNKGDHKYLPHLGSFTLPITHTQGKSDANISLDSWPWFPGLYLEMTMNLECDGPDLGALSD